MTINEASQNGSHTVTAQSPTTLLLDYTWLPLRIVPAGRVFYYIYRDRIASLDKNMNAYTKDEWISVQDRLLMDNEYPQIRSAKDSWAVPTIAVIKHPFKRDHRVSKRICFDELLDLYNYTCQICLKKYPKRSFDPKDIFNRDHVIPRSKGGPDEDFNIVLACRKCNTEKGAQYPYSNANGEAIRIKNRSKYSHVTIGATIRKEWIPFLFKDRVA